MNIYKKYIFPKYLNWVMNNKDLVQHRKDTVSGLTGIGLEIGFGSGLNLPYYKNITKLYTLDPSTELYDIAKTNMSSVVFPTEHISASAMNIPLPDHSLDFTVSTWSLCSIPDPEQALKEVFRVLKSGGKFSFIDHGKSPKDIIHKVQNFLTPISKNIAGGCNLNRDIENLIISAGFEILKLEKFSLKRRPLAFLYKGIAIAKK